MKRYTENDYVNKCKELRVEYVGIHRENKKGTIIEYICPNHVDKGVQFTDWSHFKSQKKQCIYCSGRKRSTEEFYQMIKNKNIIFLSEYLGAEKPLICKCNKCGNIWTTNRPIDLIKRNGCY